MVTLITCLPARSPREPLQQALRTRAGARAPPRPSRRGARACAVGGAPAPHPGPAPGAGRPASVPRLGSCQRRARRGRTQRALSTVISAWALPSPCRPSSTRSQSGGARTWGPCSLALPGRPPPPRRDPPVGPARLRAAPFRLEPLPSATPYLVLGRRPTETGAPGSWSPPLRRSGGPGHLWVSRPGQAPFMCYLGSHSRPMRW